MKNKISDVWTCTKMSTNAIFQAKLLSKTVYYFLNGLFLLFQLWGKSIFSRFPPKKFHNIHYKLDCNWNRKKCYVLLHKLFAFINPPADFWRPLPTQHYLKTANDDDYTPTTFVTTTNIRSKSNKLLIKFSQEGAILSFTYGK